MQLLFLVMLNISLADHASPNPSAERLGVLTIVYLPVCSAPARGTDEGGYFKIGHKVTNKRPNHKIN